ncbi:hypothetical protein [Burkholderia sp. WSM2232]|uniref:hypothetical protein n=1 Tax=Burkholderia sp. WSM2232 TaxID=944436 RepID=UPI000413336A|nr:hypothetical protein [Burkholderia sp. WSM2232]
MSNSDPDALASLRRLATTWLQRPLTAAELAELEQFQQSTAKEQPGQSAVASAVASAAASTDPAVHARLQAAQALNEGRQRSESLIREVLQKLKATAAQALQAQEREEQAILKIVETAQSLNDLRPSMLVTPASGLPPAAQLALPQIADRLANLVKTEVEQCFERYFGPLQRQLASALAQLDNAANAAPAPASATATATTANESTPTPTPASQSPSEDVHATSATPAAH